MKKLISVYLQLAGISCLFLLVNLPATAHEKVVVVPLSSGSSGRIPTIVSEGQEWMDRNLGALRVAGSKSDSLAYGWLYQWGRGPDGHESRTSPTTTTPSDYNSPEHGDFINSHDDWRSTPNNNLWQSSGLNNPCPAGFRLPTDLEWEAERVSWNDNNAAGAFASPLKLVAAGYREYGGGNLWDVGSLGLYWSSTVLGSSSRALLFSSTNASFVGYMRAYGQSVRCLKD